MPTLVWLDLTALLYDRTSSRCVALAETLETVSHDRLTKMLQADWSGQRLLESAFRTLFIWERGHLILDDTVIPRLFATAIESLAWVFSARRASPSMAFRSSCWSGRMRCSASLWVYGSGAKVGPRSTSWRWNYSVMPAIVCTATAYVLFDAWYPSKRLLKRIRDYGWYFVCRLKKNRLFNGRPLRAYRRHPYWTKTGWLTGG
jgi:DDE family transposase